MRDFAVVVERCAGRHVPGSTDAVRLFHGRGHAYAGFEDITVDCFGPIVLVACFSDDEAGAAVLAGKLGECLDGVTGVGVQLRAHRRARFSVVAGQIPDELTVTEHGLNFLIRPGRNLNVGLFLDAEPARHWVRQRAQGRRVLNLFAYTCGFSVAALAGGAAQVVNVDMSRSALAWGRQNHLSNGHDLRSIYNMPRDVFRAWSRLRQRGPFDLVIVDPPTHQAGSFNAERQYGQVLKRVNALTAPGAWLLACLNSPFLHTDFLPAQAAKWCPGSRFEGYLPASDDFPDRYADRALKMAVFRWSG